MTAAVSSTPFPDVTLDPDAVRDAVKRARLVVADCNLTAPQLETVVRAAAEADRRVFLLGVSESKVERALGLPVPVDVLFVTENEAASAFGGWSAAEQSFDPGAYGFDRVIVTRGREGFHAVTGDGVDAYLAPSVEAVATTTGAGDALVSGLAQAVVQTDADELDVGQALPVMLSHVRAVLGRDASTTGVLDDA